MLVDGFLLSPNLWYIINEAWLAFDTCLVSLVCENEKVGIIKNKKVSNNYI